MTIGSPNQDGWIELQEMKDPEVKDDTIDRWDLSEFLTYKSYEYHKNRIDRLWESYDKENDIDHQNYVAKYTKEERDIHKAGKILTHFKPNWKDLIFIKTGIFRNWLTINIYAPSELFKIISHDQATKKYITGKMLEQLNLQNKNVQFMSY